MGRTSSPSPRSSSQIFQFLQTKDLALSLKGGSDWAYGGPPVDGWHAQAKFAGSQHTDGSVVLLASYEAWERNVPLIDASLAARSSPIAATTDAFCIVQCIAGGARIAAHPRRTMPRGIPAWAPSLPGPPSHQTAAARRRAVRTTR